MINVLVTNTKSVCFSWNRYQIHICFSQNIPEISILGLGEGVPDSLNKKNLPHVISEILGLP